MNKMKGTGCKVCFSLCSLLLIFIVGCGPTTSTIVILGRDNYIPQLNTNDYKQFHGKHILFHSIKDQATNTSNIAFYNPERTVG